MERRASLRHAQGRLSPVSRRHMRHRGWARTPGAPSRPLNLSSLPWLWLTRYFDPERGSFFFRAFDGNLAAVIAHYRLHNRQPETRAMLLGRVIRSEQAAAFFLGQTGAGIGDRDFNSIAQSRGANRQLSALGHGVDRVEHQVLERAMQ